MSNTNGEYMTRERKRSLREATDEVKRELNVRSRCFPRWVADGRVSETDAHDRLDRLASALDWLEVIAEADDTNSVADITARVTADEKPVDGSKPF